MNKKFKTLLAVLAVMVMTLAFTACGSSDPAADIDPDAYVTPEQFNELQSGGEWSDMSFEEMQEYLQVAGVVDEEATESWGDGYLVVDFPGPDDDSGLHVLFRQGDDGEWGCSSMSTTGALSE